MTIEYVKTSEIKENDENPRFISEDKFTKLKKSIKDFPEMLEKRPLIVDENMVVLGGNMRLKALKDLGFKEIPIIRAIGWTEDQKKEFVIKDNLGFGSWDWDVLANEWDSVKLGEWGMDLPSYFDQTSLDGFFDEPEPGDENASNKIVLEYPEDECLEIKESLLHLASTPEEAVRILLAKHKQ
jgi:hypothetical protein